MNQLFPDGHFPDKHPKPRRLRALVFALYQIFQGLAALPGNGGLGVQISPFDGKIGTDQVVSVVR